MPPRRGFSLIELLMVIAIIGIIATIAIPILLSARQRSLDEKARQSIRNVVSAQAAYYARFGNYGQLATLATTDIPYLDQRFNSAVPDLGHGLLVNCTVSGTGQEFQVTVTNPAGKHDYHADQSGLITELP